MAAKTSRLHVTALATLQPRLLEALRTFGLTSAELEELFARHISATCVNCGLRLTGEELSQVGMASSHEVLADPKLARIKQGYCGRNGCDSYFFTLTLEQHFKVNWDRVLKTLETAAPGGPDADAGGTSAAEGTAAEAGAGRRRWKRVGIGVGVLLVLLLLRHLMYGGRIPLLQTKPNYQVNPESFEEPPPPAPPAPAATTNKGAKYRVAP